MESRTHLSWKCHFLCALFSFLTSTEQCLLRQRCTCLPSVVINTMKSVCQRFILLLVFHSLFLCHCFTKYVHEVGLYKISRLLYFKQFSSSMSSYGSQVKHFTCHRASVTEYTYTENTMGSNFFVLFLRAEPYLKRKGTCFLKPRVTVTGTVSVCSLRQMW